MKQYRTIDVADHQKISAAVAADSVPTPFRERQLDAIGARVGVPHVESAAIGDGARAL